MESTEQGGPIASRPFSSVGAVALALTAIATLPLLCLAVVFAVMLDQRERMAVEKELHQKTAQLVGNVERELARTATVLEALAASPVLERGDFQTFHDSANRIIKLNPNIDRILVIDAAARHVAMDSRLPVGSPPVPLAETESFEQVLRTGRPAVMKRIVQRRQPGTPLIGVRVPIFVDGEVKFVVTGLFGFADLHELVRNLPIPETWFAWVLDSEGKILARKPHDDRLVGRPADPDLVAAVHAGASGVVHGTTLDGVEVRASGRRIDLAEWGALVGVPARLADWPLRQFTLVLIASIAIGVLTAAFITSLFSRRFLAQHRLIADLSASIGAKNLLLAEVHHRVRNNLHLISTLISLRQQTATEETTAQLREIKTRVHAMGELYNHLYDHLDFSQVRLDDFLGAVIRSLTDSYADLHPNVQIEVALHPVSTSAEKAVPLSLILIELVTNAYKHAFSEGVGTISVRLSGDDEGATLEVADTGVGRAEAGGEMSGLRIVQALSQQLGGRFLSDVDRGTRVRVHFPLDGR
jgi:two-component sensor histidine kinase